MTNRLAGVLVTFDHGIREDDAEAVINALHMIKGVLDVRPVPDNFELAMAKVSVRSDLRHKLWDALKDEEL